MNLTEARSRAAELGMSEKDFDTVLDYTRQKLRANGKGEDYLPVLLETETMDFVMRRSINRLSKEMGEVRRCAMCAT